MLKTVTLYLVSLLGHDDFTVREAAQTILVIAANQSEEVNALVRNVKTKDSEIQHRLEVIDLHWYARIDREMSNALLGVWTFKGPGEGDAGARFNFLPNGKVEYFAWKTATTPSVTHHWCIRKKSLYISGFGEQYYLQPDNSYRLQGTRDLQMIRLNPRQVTSK